MIARWRAAARRVRAYVAHDLREIVAPSSLPNPPGYVPPPPRSLRERAQALAAATREYVDSFNAEKLEAAARRHRGEPPPPPAAGAAAPEEPTFSALLQDLAAAARGGSKALRPFAQELYRTRAAAYRDSAREFIEGYRAGFREAREGGAGGAAGGAAGAPTEQPPPPPPPPPPRAPP